MESYIYKLMGYSHRCGDCGLRFNTTQPTFTTITKENGSVEFKELQIKKVDACPQCTSKNIIAL